MKTGGHLKIEPMGDAALGVRLEGNRKKPEPIHFRVTFPGGNVDVVRTTDDQYWVHVCVHHRDHGAFDPDSPEGRIVDARLDILDRNTSEVDVGEFNSPNLYHAAFRIARP